MRRLRERVGDEKGRERRRQPEERRRLQIDPEAERRHASSRAPTRRLTRRKTPTVAISVATVETTSAAASASALVAQEAEILDHADARRHEQERQRGEQSARRLPEVARRQRLLVERPPAPVDDKRHDEQRKPDHRAGRRQRQPARQNLADELKNEEDEETADHRVFVAATRRGGQCGRFCGQAPAFMLVLRPAGGRNERDPKARGDSGVRTSSATAGSPAPTRIGRLRVFGVCAATSSTRPSPPITAASSSAPATAALSSFAASWTRCAARSRFRTASSSATPACRRTGESNSASGFTSATSSRRATATSWATASISPRGLRALPSPARFVFRRTPIGR